MKKILLAALFMAFAVGYIHDADAAPRRESLEITTYYPAPFGVYHELESDYLKMNSQDPAVAEGVSMFPCDNNNPQNAGRIYYADDKSGTETSMRVCLRVEDPIGSGTYKMMWQDITAGGASGGRTFVLDTVDPNPPPFNGYRAYAKRLKFNPANPDYLAKNSDNVFLNKDISGEDFVVRTRDKARYIYDNTTMTSDWSCVDGSDLDYSLGARRCYPAALSVKGFADISVAGAGLQAAARVGIGTDNPNAVLDIVGEQDSSSNDGKGRPIPVVRVNNKALVTVLRIRHDPLAGVNLRPAAGAEAAFLPLGMNSNDYFCTVGGKSAKYVPKPISVSDNEHDSAWVYVNAGQWFLRYADPLDLNNAANANYRPRVEVICYPKETVTRSYLPADPSNNIESSHDL